MREDFANQTMLKVPQIMDAKAGYRKAFGQVRAYGFNSFAQPRADLQSQVGLWGVVILFARGSDHEDAMPVRQQGLAKGIDKAAGSAGTSPANPSPNSSNN